MTTFKVVSVNISENTGEKKKPVDKVMLKARHGILGDAHAKDWHRQISLLAKEDIDSMRNKGIELKYGDFAENITTEGIALSALPVGTRLKIDNAILEITQIGKECHMGCEIRKQVGDCVMPRRGVFAKVLVGGEILENSKGAIYAGIVSDEL